MSEKPEEPTARTPKPGEHLLQEAGRLRSKSGALRDYSAELCARNARVMLRADAAARLCAMLAAGPAHTPPAQMPEQAG